MKVLNFLSRHFALFALPFIMSPGLISIANAQDKKTETQNAPVTIEASDFLEWDQNKGLYLAKGNAIAVQRDMRISADRLEAKYDPEQAGRAINVMTATGNVAFVDGENTATGTQLVYNLLSSTYSVFGKNAKVTSPHGIMTATKKIIYDESNPAKAKLNGIGNANYTADDGRVISGDEIIAFTNETGDLQTLDAIGNAYVRTVDNQTATGDMINYDFNTSIAIVTGNVELIEGQNVMWGAWAEVDFNSGVSRLLSDGQGGRVTGIMVQ